MATRNAHCVEGGRGGERSFLHLIFGSLPWALRKTRFVLTKHFLESLLAKPLLEVSLVPLRAQFELRRDRAKLSRFRVSGGTIAPSATHRQCRIPHVRENETKGQNCSPGGRCHLEKVEMPSPLHRAGENDRELRSEWSHAIGKHGHARWRRPMTYLFPSRFCSRASSHSNRQTNQRKGKAKAVNKICTKES